MSTILLTMAVLLCVTSVITLPIVAATETAQAAIASDVNATDKRNITDMKELHLIGLFPHSGMWRGGDSIQTAIQLAMDQINSMDAIPGYRLRITAHDTKCDPGLAIKAMVEELYTPPTKLMIIGGGCSGVSEATALASHFWNLVQVSYASVSPTLSDKSKFPLFARLKPSALFPNHARMNLLRHFGWNRIATIHQSYPIFGQTTEDLVDLLDQEGFEIIRSEVFSDDPSHPIRRLRDDDCRITFASSYQEMTRTMLCQAYKTGLYGPKIVWIFLGWFETYWWKSGNTSECTQKELDEAIEGSFEVAVVPLQPYQVPSVSGWRPLDFQREYKKAVNNRQLPMENFAPFGYDSMWAIALALNNTRKILQDMGSSKGLEDFTYNDSDIGSLLYSSLLNLTFMGIKGPTHFDRNGDPSGLIQITRVQGGVKQILAYYDMASKNDSHLQWTKDNAIIWKGGRPPRDGVEKRTVYVTLSEALYVTLCVIAALGILLAGGFLAFNILLRHVRIVKMSSPRLNNVILLGCICAYITIFIQEHGAGHGTLGCQINTALLVLGMSMSFGALFAKTWRVHIIFSNTFQRLQRTILTDARLLGMVLLLVMVDICVLVTWWLVDSRVLKNRVIEITKEEDDIGDVEVTYKERYCKSDHQKIFLGILYAIHALLLLWGTLLAFETRNVHYPELNDSKYIGMCIYNVTLMIIPGVVLDVALKSGINLMYGLNAALILFGTTVTQCLIFVPKVVSYYVKRAADEEIQGSANQQMGGASIRSTGTPSTRCNVAEGASNPCTSATFRSVQLDQTPL